MGVPGLWDILYELGRSRSLMNLAVQEGFEGNRSGRRAYRIGVDASLWYAHAAFAKGGENPDLRLLFFRCLQLAKLAIVPYFVFDGRQRPPIKRGSKKGKAGSHTLTPGFKKIIECFGWTWREAPGEAEAELAHLNREGIIDAVLTDDGDALIFGAKVIIRKQSNNLTGNKSKPALDSNGKSSKDHVMIFTEDALAQRGFNRAGLILIALLCGGDYVQEGIKGFGKATATGLACAGFGQELLSIYALRDDPDYAMLMDQWRSDVNDELRTNSKGFLKHKHASLTLPASFPDLKILGYYADPTTSRGQSAPQIRDADSICLPRLAAFCEKHFGEWGYEETIIKRFRTLVWESVLCQLLRRAALQVDEQERERRLRRGDYNRDIRAVLRPTPTDAHGLSESFVTGCVGRREDAGISDAFVNRPASAITSQPNESKNVLQMKVVGTTRNHASTDGLLEYRVEFTPTLFVELTRLGISGKRGDPPLPSSRADVDPWDVDFGPESSRPKAAKESSKPPPLPDSPQRVWVCAAMLGQVFPDLVDDAASARAGKKKAPKTGQRASRSGSSHFSDGSSDVETLRAQSSPPPPHTMPRAPKPVRHTASQPVAGPSKLPARRAVSPMRSPLLPTQPRARSAVSLPTEYKSGFKFTFPYTDDPDKMLLEDGLDLPLASSAPTRQPRPQAPSGVTGSSTHSSHPLRRTSPPRADPSVRRTASQVSGPSTASGSGHSRNTNRNDNMGFDVTGMFGGGDSDDADEEEPDIIRHASSTTNNRMDQIFDSVFKPRGKGKAKAKAKRTASAPSASQSRPTKKPRTTQPPSQDLADLLPPSPPRPRRVSPASAPAASRAAALTQHPSDASRSQASRASSEVIEIDSDSDDDVRTLTSMRQSSQSIHFLSDDDNIIDLS